MAIFTNYALDVPGCVTESLPYSPHHNPHHRPPPLSSVQTPRTLAFLSRLAVKESPLSQDSSASGTQVSCFEGVVFPSSLNIPSAFPQPPCPPPVDPAPISFLGAYAEHSGPFLPLSPVSTDKCASVREQPPPLVSWRLLCMSAILFLQTTSSRTRTMSLSFCQSKHTSLLMIYTDADLGGGS